MPLAQTQKYFTNLFISLRSFTRIPLPFLLSVFVFFLLLFSYIFIGTGGEIGAENFFLLLSFQRKTFADGKIIPEKSAEFSVLIKPRKTGRERKGKTFYHSQFETEKLILMCMRQLCLCCRAKFSPLIYYLYRRIFSSRWEQIGRARFFPGPLAFLPFFCNTDFDFNQNTNLFSTVFSSLCFYSLAITDPAIRHQSIFASNRLSICCTIHLRLIFKLISCLLSLGRVMILFYSFYVFTTYLWRNLVLRLQLLFHYRSLGICVSVCSMF